MGFAELSEFVEAAAKVRGFLQCERSAAFCHEHEPLKRFRDQDSALTLSGVSRCLASRLNAQRTL